MIQKYRTLIIFLLVTSLLFSAPPFTAKSTIILLNRSDPLPFSVVVNATGTGDYENIQEGIDNIREGGTVFMEEGRGG